MTDRVISMSIELSQAQSAELIISSLESTLDAMEAIADEAPLPAGTIDRLDEIDTRVSLLLARLRCKRSIVHLVSRFGRAP